MKHISSKLHIVMLTVVIVLLFTTIPASAQYYLNIRKSDGTSVQFVVTDIDSLWFTQTVKPIYGDTTGIAGDTIDIINRITDMFLPGLISQNKEKLDASIFYRALEETRLSDSLNNYLDWMYPAPESGSNSRDFIENGIGYQVKIHGYYAIT